MEFLLNNWFFIILTVATLTVLGVAIVTFLKMPTDQQLDQIKEWLLYAVAEAEKELGSGTGKLKLRYVYDMFLVRFGVLAKIISFEVFSIMVDEVLEDFRDILENNTSIASYIKE